MKADASSSTRARAAIVGAFAVGAVVLVGYEVLQLVSDNRAPQVVSGIAPTASAHFVEPSVARAETYSNIYKYDYVGPESCGSCHSKNYEKWKGHPHSRMNRNPSATTVMGDFGDARIDYGGGHATFSKAGGEFLVTLYVGDKPERQYKVTRVVGSRFIQMYIGTQLQGPEPESDAVYTQEVKLPFAYWIDRKEWFPQTYDENVEGKEYDEHHALTRDYAYQGKATGDWQRVCIKCHNTYPYALRFDPAAKGGLLGFPPGDVTLKTLPSALRANASQLAALETSDLVTMGISCESCHFGGREHAQKGASISFVPKSADITLASTPPAGTGESPYAVNSICHQCHSAEPQGPLYPDGSASWNAREAVDIVASACKSKISCIDCHNPHEAGPAKADAPDRAEHIAACVGCHDKLKTPESAAAHSFHQKPESATCLDCHMPRIVHGLAGFTRTHRISSPTDPRMLKGNFPNACNLCHLDKSLKWTLGELASKWGKKPDLGADFVASDEPLGKVWLKHESPVVRHVAAAAYGRSPTGRSSLVDVLPILDDASPPVRMFGVLAIEDMLDRHIGVDEYTPWAAPETRKKQIEQLERSAKTDAP